MSVPTIASINALSTLSSNDANRHKSTVTPYDGLVSDLLSRYVSAAVTAKVDEEICNFKRGSLTP